LSFFIKKVEEDAEKYKSCNPKNCGKYIEYCDGKCNVNIKGDYLIDHNKAAKTKNCSFHIFQGFDNDRFVQKKPENCILRQ